MVPLLCPFHRFGKLHRGPNELLWSQSWEPAKRERTQISDCWQRSSQGYGERPWRRCKPTPWASILCHFIFLNFRPILTKQGYPKNFRGKRKCSPSPFISVQVLFLPRIALENYTFENWLSIQNASEKPQRFELYFNCKLKEILNNLQTENLSENVSHIQN